MKQTDFLDLAKKALGVESDYALAPRLELSRQAVSKLRNRRLYMSNTTAAKIAEITGIELGFIIIALENERGTHSVFKRLARKVAGVLIPAALAIGAASFGVAPSPAQASSSSAVVRAAPAGLCIMSNRRRRSWWSVLWP